jgi:glycosyltransferase involved in cell wall biosynthesis
MSTVPKISYLVTCKNEGKQLSELVEYLAEFSLPVHDEIVIIDDYSTEVQTCKYLTDWDWFEKGNINIHKHELNKNYSEHKNYGKSKCSGDWIFQIDADEMPAETLMTNLHEILSSNENVELFWVPRINVFNGVTAEHAAQWGWDINNPNKWVNWNSGDYQGRIFKNLPHLRWERPLHERIEGYKVSSKFPKEEEFALIHTKTIEKQIQTNIRYNTDFSEAMNRGHKIP